MFSLKISEFKTTKIEAKLLSYARSWKTDGMTAVSLIST
jgi:hypothetical protein